MIVFRLVTENFPTEVTCTSLNDHGRSHSFFCPPHDTEGLREQNDSMPAIWKVVWSVVGLGFGCVVQGTVGLHCGIWPGIDPQRDSVLTIGFSFGFANGFCFGEYEPRGGGGVVG